MNQYSLADIVASFSQTGAARSPTPQEMMLATIIDKLNRIEAKLAQQSGKDCE